MISIKQGLVCVLVTIFLMPLVYYLLELLNKED